ncbi:hypothetical protein [Burkholderia sp. BCC1644]|uniref:hypothetical protein n=1 Tax=Burkholderia sp. BCC1644 TaxID=2676293 RepID=UPI001FC80407|nr:hypothetical protein [Burkholderia sp. BCC1644]
MRTPLFCLLLLASLPARAGTACDALLGDYAPAAGKPATMRVEKVGGDIVLRMRDAGRWSVETAPTHVAELDMDGPVKPPADACILDVPGGELIKMPIGAPYQVTSITGSNFTTKHSTTGVLLRMMQGFQVDGIELYPVARSGDSPPAAVKAVRGREVAGTGPCPGYHAPDMSQADFDGLSDRVRTYFGGLDAVQQRAFVCGQTLDEIVGDGLSSSDAKTVDAMWRWLDVMLHAHQVPRDEHGSDDRWRVAGQLLRHNHSDDGAKASPDRARRQALVLDLLVPNLPPPDTLRDGREEQASDLVAEIMKLPEPDALAALGKLQARGVLRWQINDNNPYRVADVALREALNPPVPVSVFTLLAKDANPDVLHDDALLDGEVTARRVDGVQRLLDAGVKPSAKVLADAADTPEILRLLKASAAR